MRGRVLWYSEAKGYGFLKPSDGGSDVFVHRSAVERAGLFGLVEGQTLTFEIRADVRCGNRKHAVDLTTG